jgi:hypothetical protein
MSETERQPAATTPEHRPFQFRLRTLLLLFVVLGSSLAVFGTSGIAVFGVVVGLAIYIQRVESLSSLAYLVLAVLVLSCVLSLLLLPAINAAREAGRRASCLNQLRQVGLALNNYYAARGSFPPACTVDKDGKPLHSWRVLILPYIEYDILYRSVDVNKPWNAPTNKNLLKGQLREFTCPSDPTSHLPGTEQTNYFAVVGPNTAWDRSRHVANSGKEAAHTIMLVEVAQSGVRWTEPKDVSLDAIAASDPNAPALVPSSNHGGRKGDFFFIYDFGIVVDVAMADGSVRVLRLDRFSPEQLRGIFKIGGCTPEILKQAEDEYYKSRRLNWPNIAALAVWLVSAGTLLVGAVRSRKPRAINEPT